MSSIEWERAIRFPEQTETARGDLVGFAWGPGVELCVTQGNWPLPAFGYGLFPEKLHEKFKLIRKPLHCKQLHAEELWRRIRREGR
ncbi:MAG: hypothetical protein C0483_13170 [Pirellula sp.]|nr:hypothetical protein [Pirellula sp.]